MKNIKTLVSFLFILCFSLFHLSTFAGVVLNGNRIIYLGSDKEKSLQFSSNDEYPNFVEVWVEENVNTNNPALSKAPFIITPQTFRLAPKSKQTVKLMYTKTRALPQDRESVFYLNFLQVPAVKQSARSHSNIFYRVNSKVKLFYRPANLPSKVSKLGEQMQLSIKRHGSRAELVVKNPSPYFITIASVNTQKGYPLLKKNETLMVSPFSQATIKLTAAQAAQLKAGNISLEYINDYGVKLTATHML